MCQQKLPYSRAWVVGEREGVLEKIIHDYKFQRNVSAVQVSADLLEKRLPYLPDNTILIPVPTITRHIRIRGYDHTVILANEIAKRRSLQAKSVLRRNHNLVQVGSDAPTRHKQAKTAFCTPERLDSNCPYLLVDDVITTGATIKYAAQALRDKGAQEIWIAALAR
jgi:predicted amidophosphoribosyltransferase